MKRWRSSAHIAAPPARSAGSFPAGSPRRHWPGRSRRGAGQGARGARRSRDSRRAPFPFRRARPRDLPRGSPHARAAARSGRTRPRPSPAALRNHGPAASWSSSLRFMWVRVRPFMLLLDLALEQLAQLFEALEAERLGELVVDRALAGGLHRRDHQIEGRGLAGQVLRPDNRRGK